MDDFGILSLIPPVLAIIIAIYTKDVIISLLNGSIAFITKLKDEKKNI